MRKLLMALVAMAGLGIAAAPSLADNGHYGNRNWNHNYGQGHEHHLHYHRPVTVCNPVVGCTSYVAPAPVCAPVYAPTVVARPGFIYNGRNISLRIGF